jgi:glycerophosphoryl diester phosphodiesterase
MHDPDLGVTTDIEDHPEFANRTRTITFATGVKVTGWIVSGKFIYDLLDAQSFFFFFLLIISFRLDFTLAEIKTLRLKQRVAIRDQIYNGLFQVPTIEDALSALAIRNAALNLSVGIYIEPKHPTFFASQGLNFDNLVPILEQHGYVMKGVEAKKTKVFLESFESTHLQQLKKQTDVRLIMLVTNPEELQEDTLKPFGDLFTSTGLDMLAQLVDGIGPNKQWFLTALDKAYAAKAQQTNSFMGLQLVEEAHRRNLRIHPWTVRNRTEDVAVDQFFSGDMMKSTTNFAFFFPARTFPLIPLGAPIL